MLQKINSEFVAMLPPWHHPSMRFALVKYGGGIIQMSGSIAGNTFARNRYGNYIRARTKPVNPYSARQARVRAIVAEIVERWSETLSDAQRTAWATYADGVAMKNKLGETVHLSGFNQYVRSNCTFRDATDQYHDDAPEVLSLAEQDGDFAIAATANDQLISVTFTEGLDWNSEPGAGMIMLDGRPQNATRNFFKGPYRGIEWLGGAQPPGNVSPQTHTGIFTLVEGQKIWVQARIIRVDGRLSEPFSANCVVAA